MTNSFLLSTPRSGSTLVSALLGSHNDILCPPEPWLLLSLSTAGIPNSANPADAQALSIAAAEFFGDGRTDKLAIAAKAIYADALSSNAKKVFVDKTPRYYHCLDLVRKFEADGKFIILLRNPLDVAASYKSTWGIEVAEILRTNSDEPALFDFVLGFRRLIEFAQSTSSLVVHYENLVREPQVQMNRIFSYLGVPAVTISDKLNLGESSLATSALGDKKILQTPAVSTSSVGAFKHTLSKDEIEIVRNALGRSLFERLGYVAEFDACGPIGSDAGEATSEQLVKCAESFINKRVAEQHDLHGYREALSTIEKLTLESEKLHKIVGSAEREIDHLRSLLRPRNYFRHFINAAVLKLGSPPRFNKGPKITVVTPVFNCEEYIAETIESVLTQDYEDVEYIIVDGGSTDSTMDIVKRYLSQTNFKHRISKVISEPDEGMYDAVAKGFRHATGEIYCYLNADDTFEPNSLDAIGRHFASHPRDNVVYFNDSVIVDGWKFANVGQPKSIKSSDLLAGHILFQDGVFWRRNAYEEIGGIRPEFRLAGDFDLWLRMSARFKFRRLSGEVSSFRMRPGQLSARMDDYAKEIARSIEDFLSDKSLGQRVWWKLERWKSITMRWLGCNRVRDTLRFPIDFGNIPPPRVTIPPRLREPANSPIDGKRAKRFLFSTPDTRFGDREINYVYMDTANQIAVIHPQIDPNKLDGLYRKYYSAPPTEAGDVSGNSPFRLYSGKGLIDRIMFRLPVERLGRLFPEAWQDNTLKELKLVLKSAGIDPANKLRFLDVGCFEGALLEKVTAQTPWHAFGIEPNEGAVEIARQKGHTVWSAHAESAGTVVPTDQQFDVIFMGQTIEHVADPVSVVRGLRMLLAPGGVLVLSTPNLRSREIKWFGPTWAHWHVPYHRHIFSKVGLVALAAQAGLSVVSFRSFSHPYWSTMSVALNKIGLGGSASHAVSFDRETSLIGQRLYVWHQLVWNRVGQGDYCFVALKDGPNVK